MKLQCEFLQTQLPLNFFSLNLYCSMPLHKYSSTSHFQNFKQCISYITFLWCETPIKLLEHIIRGKNCPSMHNFTVEIRNGSYMFQLHSSHQTIYGRSIKGNHVPIFYILLQMISGRYFGLTYKGM